MEPLVYKAKQVPLALKDRLEPLVLQVTLVLLARQDKLEPLALQDQLEPLDHKDHRAMWEPLDLEPQVPPDKVPQVPRAQQDHKAMWAPQAQVVTPAIKVPLDHKDSQAPPALQDKQVPQG
jgi:hypothetical protein